MGIPVATSPEHDPAWLRYEQQLELWKTEIKRVADWQNESFKATIQFATMTIKTALLINGGAVIAMLALLGNLWSKDSNGQLAAQRIAAQLDRPLTCFIIGLFTAAVTSAGAYLAQHFFTRDKNNIGIPIQMTSIVICAVSIIAFATGSYYAVHAFRAGLTP
mgnify:CR=1 FL=1